MDPQRFDSLAKRFGTRLSRRGALRAGVGAALGAVTIAKLAPTVAQDDETTAKSRHVSIRSYAYTGPISAAEAGLKGLIPVMYEQPGFISIQFIDSGDRIHVVITYLDQSSADAGAEQLDDWIAAHAQAILRGEPEIAQGGVFLRSELYTGCPCTTDEEDSCNSSRLTCCPTSDVDGGPGICLTTASICPGQAEEEDSETDESTAEPTLTPTQTPVDASTCTGSGCACVAGVDGACDGGLQCCGTGELGGVGVCQSDCAGICTSEGCGCVSGAEGACDDGLLCCSTGDPGSVGACFSSCGGGTGCTSDGCACTAGAEDACDSGLQCCGSEPGAEGICQVACETVGICPGGEGCDCTDGVEGDCDDGLACCGASQPGGTGTCQSACA